MSTYRIIKPSVACKVSFLRPDSCHFVQLLPVIYRSFCMTPWIQNLLGEAMQTYVHLWKMNGYITYKLYLWNYFEIPSKSFSNLFQIITSNLASAPYKIKSRIALVSDSDQGLVPIYVGWHVSVEVCLRWWKCVTFPHL